MIEQWILVVNSLSVITPIFLINFNDQHQAGLSWWGVWRNKCPQVDRVGLSWQGQVVDIQLEYSWSISVMLNNAPNYLGREAPVFCSVQILHIMTILSLASFTDQVVCLHRVLIILTQFTRQSDLPVQWQCSADWRILKCSTIVVVIKQLHLSSPPLSAVTL